VARKTKTLDQVERMQAKAIRFLRDVVGDPDKADEIEDLSPEEYAERKGAEIVEENPRHSYGLGRRREVMTKSQLEERIAELEEENEDLQSRLDSIGAVVQPEASGPDDEDERR
jgi:hypothetical protein